MKRIRNVLIIKFHMLVLIFAILLTPAMSQTSGKTHSNTEICIICKDGKHTNENPYVKGFKHELPFLIAGAGLLTSGFVLQSVNNTNPFTIDELNNLNRDNINAFDRPASYNYSPQAATASDILGIGVLILPSVFLSTHHTRSDLGSLFVMGLEVVSITYGLTLSVKNTVNRTRPYVYNPDVAVDERTNSVSRKSFFSGHTSFTASVSFFTAKVFSDYHPNMKTGVKVAVWSTAAIIPAITGYLRYESGQHFPTDVLAGYAIGAVTGWLVPELHKKNKRSANYSLAPVIIYGTPGLYLAYRF